MTLVVQRAGGGKLVLDSIIVEHIHRWEEMFALDGLHSQVHAVRCSQELSVLCCEAVDGCGVEKSRELVDLLSDRRSLSTLTELRAGSNDKQAWEGDNGVIVQRDFFALRGSAAAIAWNVA